MTAIRETVSAFSIFALACYLSWTFLDKAFDLHFDPNFTVVKVHDTSSVKLSFGTGAGGEVREEVFKTVSVQTPEEMPYFQYGGRTYLISSDKDGFDVGLISKQVDRSGILSLYSHNYPNKETSGTRFYREWSVGTRLKGANGKTYEVFWQEDFRISAEKDPVKIRKSPDLSFIYFTCHPGTDKWRRVYGFREVS